MYRALSPGPRSAREAVEVAGLHRATGYRVLLRLLDRGIVRDDGRNPRGFRSVEPSVLFQRLGMFYQDEAEIAGFLSEAFGRSPESLPAARFGGAVPDGRPRILAAQGRAPHPAVVKVAEARHSVGVMIRPLASPVPYRLALSKALGQAARDGASIRLITDATPADYRFWNAVVRESGEARGNLQLRHYSPLAAHLYAIDRRRIVRLPALGGSSRAPPVAVVLEDPANVRAHVNRFEALWTEASPPARPRARVGTAAARNGTDRFHTPSGVAGPVN